MFNFQNLTANPIELVEFNITVPANGTLDLFAFGLGWGDVLQSPEIEQAISNGNAIALDANNAVIPYTNYQTIIDALGQLANDFPVLQGTVQGLIQQVQDVEVANQTQDSIIALLQAGMTQVQTDITNLQANDAVQDTNITALQNSVNNINADVTSLQTAVAQAQADATQALEENDQQDVAIEANKADADAKNDAQQVQIDALTAALQQSGDVHSIDNSPASAISSTAPNAGTAYDQNADFGAGGQVDFEATLWFSGNNNQRYPFEVSLLIDNVEVEKSSLKLTSNFVSASAPEAVRFFQRITAPAGTANIKVRFVSKASGQVVTFHRIKGDITKA